MIVMEVSSTMPSVGISFVASRYLRRTAGSSLAVPTGGLVTSTKRSRVENRLTISRIGAFSAAGHSAYTKPASYFSSRSSFDVAALPFHVSAPCRRK